MKKCLLQGLLNLVLLVFGVAFFFLLLLHYVMPFERWERAKKKKIIWGLIEAFLCFFDFEGSCSSLCFFVFFCFGCCYFVPVVCVFLFLFLFLFHFAVLEILVGKKSSSWWEYEAIWIRGHVLLFGK